jgi:hypothetical protein
LQAFCGWFASEFASADTSVVCRDERSRNVPADLRDEALIAPRGVEPPVPAARLTIPGRIVQTSPPTLTQTTRKEVTMTSSREAWLCVLQDADGNEETELITIERGREGTAPVIEVTNGVRITCTQPATMTATGAERPAA